MSCLITGATGFVGGYVAEACRERGMALRTIARPTSDTKLLTDLGVDIVPGDLTDPDQIAQFGWFDPLANIGFAVLFWGGLRYRHKVHLHARYMLGTTMFVVAPIVWRLLRGYSPTIREMPFSYPFAVANLVAIAIALALYRLAPKHGRPWLIAAGFIAAQEITFETLGRLPAWAPIFARVADSNLPFLLLITGIASLGIAWHGWVAGARPVAPKAAAAA